MTTVFLTDRFCRFEEKCFLNCIRQIIRQPASQGQCSVPNFHARDLLLYLAQGNPLLILLPHRSMSSQSMLVRRPFRSEHKQPNYTNIFTNQQQLTFLPKLEKKPSNYDFVGPDLLRQQLLQEQTKQSLPAVDSLDQLEEMHRSTDMSKPMQATSKQQTIFSKLTHSQAKEMTRDIRNIRNYREQQAQWDRLSDRIKRQGRKEGHPTLLERSKKHLQVLPNPEKDEIIKNYVTSYWEMSLRNNSLILKRHIKGHNRYNEQEMEGLLQRQEGIRQVEGSMPALPVAELNRLGQGELQVRGRSKIYSQSLSLDGSKASELSGLRRSLATELSRSGMGGELLRMNYDSRYKFLSGEIV